jgi:RNA polymerase sigma-70 factor, ECF subfamily
MVVIADMDAVLVEHAMARQPGAFEVLVEKYQPLVLAYTRQLLDSIPEAEDVAQETFLRAFQELNSLREPARFGAWLKSIAWRECRGWVRKQQAARRHRQQAARVNPAYFDPLCELEPEVEDPWLRRLAQTIDDLSEGKKAVLALFYLRNLSHEMIADFLGIPLGTVKRRLFEARQAVAGSAESPNQMDLAERKRFVEAFKSLLSSQAGDKP